MNLSNNFTLEELTHSEVAERKNLDNTPNASEVANLTRLAALLEQVRSLLGKPIMINSGFRSKPVNDFVILCEFRTVCDQTGTGEGRSLCLRHGSAVAERAPNTADGGVVYEVRLPLLACANAQNCVACGVVDGDGIGAEVVEQDCLADADGSRVRKRDGERPCRCDVDDACDDAVALACANWPVKRDVVGERQREVGNVCGVYRRAAEDLSETARHL